MNYNPYFHTDVHPHFWMLGETLPFVQTSYILLKAKWDHMIIVSVNLSCFYISVKTIFTFFLQIVQITITMKNVSW